jgi:hypothetical protein
MIADMRGFIFNGPGDVPMLKYNRIICFFPTPFAKNAKKPKDQITVLFSFWDILGS